MNKFSECCQLRDFYQIKFGPLLRKKDQIKYFLLESRKISQRKRVFCTLIILPNSTFNGVLFPTTIYDIWKIDFKLKSKKKNTGLRYAVDQKFTSHDLFIEKRNFNFKRQNVNDNPGNNIG